MVCFKARQGDKSFDWGNGFVKQVVDNKDIRIVRGKIVTGLECLV